MPMKSDPRRIEFPPTCQPTTVALYQYWLERCGERRMPLRRDIDPTEMPRGVLPGITLVEVVPDRRYVYRLVGTGEVEVRGNDPTGKSVWEGFFAPSAEDAIACYDRVVATRPPLLDPMLFTAPSGKYVMEETLFLPLSEDGTNVNKILVYSYSRERGSGREFGGPRLVCADSQGADSAVSCVPSSTPWSVLGGAKQEAS